MVCGGDGVWFIAVVIPQANGRPRSCDVPGIK